MFRKCKHQWTKQSDTVMKSALENDSNHQFETNDTSAMLQFIKQCHVVILTCNVCGKVRKDVTYNPLL
jgi:hypothetical protein